MTRRTRYVLVLLLALFLVNLPLVHGLWTDRQVAAVGIEVTATVVDHDTVQGDHLLSFRFPRSIDPDQLTRRVQVDAATYDRVVETGELPVRVLEDDPAAYTVEGEVTSPAIVVVTLIGNLVLAIVALLLWRYGGRRRRPQLEAVAMGDVERCPPGAALERLAEATYLVRGEVTELAPDRLVIELGGRSVLVHLDGHRNPVGHQQSAQVQVRLV